ncbi:MAG TPA: hypothetical protein VKA50_12220 [Gammaproteobacteria bacterium]|nr:hypothetical protein [Gammaproteobacteria bacterium]
MSGFMRARSATATGAALVLGVTALSLPAAGARAADGAWTVSAGGEYSSGDYGASSSTTILYLPFSAQYETDRYRFKVTVPIIRVEGPPGVVRDIGSVRPRGTPASTTSTTNTGLGDVMLQGSMNVYSADMRRTLVDITGKVKLGTADENKNLGTGENDYFMQVDGYKTIERTTWLGTLGYALMGDPPGINFKNVPYLSVGASYRVQPDLSVGGMYYTRDPVIAGGYRQEELTGFMTRRLDRQRKVQVYALLGLASGSPDYGMGAIFSYRF